MSAALVACSPEAGQIDDETLAAILAASQRDADAATLAGCDLERPPFEHDGVRRLALLVGVGDYKSRRIPDLSGPAADVGALYQVLIDEFGYAEQNVCVLIDDAATLAGVRDAFSRVLTERARPGDSALFFYAGHGSQSPDASGDEPDGKDETFVLHDSRTDGVPDLSDDEFHRWLLALHERTREVTVVLDSCNSGSASRVAPEDPDGDSVARFLAPLEDAIDVSDASPSAREADGGAWVPATLDGIVVLSAARDGTSALESRALGHGYFTNSLIENLRTPSARPLTWAQVSLRMNRQVSNQTSGRQIPVFQGDLESFVLDTRERKAALGWRVTQDDPLTLRGAVIPGWGVDAELRLYPGNASFAEVRDPAGAKAVLRVDTLSAVEANASVIGKQSSPIEVGDLAVLATPSPNVTKIQVDLASLPAPEMLAVQKAVADDEVLARILDLEKGGGAFSVGSDAGVWTLRGPEGEVRNRFDGENSRRVPALLDKLSQYAQQRSLLWIEGEAGGDFVNNETLAVKLVRAPPDTPGYCAKPGWVQACANEEQAIPLCTLWQIEVTNLHPKADLWIGGAALSNSGEILGFPLANEAFLLEAGKTAVVPDLVLQANPPLNALEHIIVFGTREQVDWSVLTSLAVRDPVAAAPTSLDARLQRFIAGERGTTAVSLGGNYGTWTSSHVPFRVVSNAQFVELDERARRCSAVDPDEDAAREYTVDVDITPYLPDDRESPLRKVLETAHALTERGFSDGVPYKQHPWVEGSDEANLDKGIDCSRAIWWAFTRADLPYSTDAEYLYTGRMVGDDSPLREHFESCLDDNLQAGDVLVYRGPSKDGSAILGHTVMVIDPSLRLGWGSHGWDGNPGAGLAPEKDTGVEYQRILRKPDWKHWDSRRYALKACWRHTLFAKR